MKRLAAGVLVVLLASGCIAPGVSIKQTVPKGEVWEVAVLPIKDAPGAEGSGRLVADLLVTELLKLPQYSVIDKGLVEKELAAAVGGMPADMDAMLKAGEKLGADAVLIGELLKYRPMRAFIFPPAEASLSLRMVEVKTGHVSWSVQHRRAYGLPHWVTSLFPFPPTMILSLIYSPSAQARAKQVVEDVAGELKKSFALREQQ